MRTRKPVVIDTDPGLDDALALILALRSPSLDVRAITVVAGNVPLAACTANTLRILEVLQPESLPVVFEGCEDPLSPRVARAEHVHGGDGLGGISSCYPVRHLAAARGHAADAMVELARRYRDDLAIVALGPLTNVATALDRDKEAMSGIRELVVMGGSGDGRGNVTPTAEFNFYSDPLAARAVVRSGLPVTLVGLNVTERALLPRERFNESLDAMQPGILRSFLGDISRPYFDFCRKEAGRDACALHDPMAVAAAIDPNLVQTERISCDIVTSQGMARGTMIADRSGSGRFPVRVATAVDARGFLDRFLGTVCGS